MVRTSPELAKAFGDKRAPRSCSSERPMRAAVRVRPARSELPDFVGDARAVEPLHRLGGSVPERVEGLGGEA